MIITIIININNENNNNNKTNTVKITVHLKHNHLMFFYSLSLLSYIPGRNRLFLLRMDDAILGCWLLPLVLPPLEGEIRLVVCFVRAMMMMTMIMMILCYVVLNMYINMMY